MVKAPTRQQIAAALRFYATTFAAAGKSSTTPSGEISRVKDDATRSEGMLQVACDESARISNESPE